MNADDVRAYKRRWELVAEAEREELERMSPAQKFADLAMLVEAARSLGGTTGEDAATAQVRRRWNLLAERMGV